MGPHNTKKLLHSKRKHQQSERQPTEWEKIFVQTTHLMALITTIYKELL